MSASQIPVGDKRRNIVHSTFHARRHLGSCPCHPSTHFSSSFQAQRSGRWSQASSRQGGRSRCERSLESVLTHPGPPVAVVTTACTLGLSLLCPGLRARGLCTSRAEMGLEPRPSPGWNRGASPLFTSLRRGRDKVNKSLSSASPRQGPRATRRPFCHMHGPWG